MTETRTYVVPDVACSHCRAAITSEVGEVSGVDTVDVDLDAKVVTVGGSALDDGAIRAAIHEAGYEVQ